jgi:hypothetical protein
MKPVNFFFYFPLLLMLMVEYGWPTYLFIFLYTQKKKNFFTRSTANLDLSKPHIYFGVVRTEFWRLHRPDKRTIQEQLYERIETSWKQGLPCTYKIRVEGGYLCWSLTVCEAFVTVDESRYLNRGLFVLYFWRIFSPWRWTEPPQHDGLVQY